MAVLRSTTFIIFLTFCANSLIYTKHVKNNVIEKECVGINVSGVIHEEGVLMNGIDRPYKLSYYKINETDNILYFSYNVGHQNESTFEIGYSECRCCPVECSRVSKAVTEVKNGFATAVNHEKNLIYLGGSEGVYVRHLNSSEHHTELLVPKHDIWDLFYKQSLYFIAYPSLRLFKHHSGDSKLQTHIHEKIYHFLIDGDGDTFISNKTGLFMIKKGSKRRIHIKGSKVFRAFEVNRKGVAHFCGQNEVYVANKEKHKLHEIAKISNIFGLTFDCDDNIIYSDPHQIVKLQRCEKELEKKEEIKKDVVVTTDAPNTDSVTLK